MKAAYRVDNLYYGPTSKHRYQMIVFDIGHSPRFSTSPLYLKSQVYFGVRVNGYHYAIDLFH